MDRMVWWMEPSVWHGCAHVIFVSWKGGGSGGQGGKQEEKERERRESHWRRWNWGESFLASQSDRPGAPTASNGCQSRQTELHHILPTADICILNLSVFPTTSPAAPGACSLAKA